MHTVAGVAMRVLSVEDQIIHAVLHARHTLFSRMRDFVDVALLLRQPVDSILLRQRAADAGATSALAHVQQLAGRWGLLDAASRPIPDLKPGWSYALIAPWRTLDPQPIQLSGGPLASLMEMWLLDTPRSAVQLARALAHPDPLFMQQTPQYGDSATYLRRAGTRLRRLVRDSAGLLAERARLLQQHTDRE